MRSRIAKKFKICLGSRTCETVLEESNADVTGEWLSRKTGQVIPRFEQFLLGNAPAEVVRRTSLAELRVRPGWLSLKISHTKHGTSRRIFRFGKLGSKHRAIRIRIGACGET
jgi:hypothetical protein